MMVNMLAGEDGVGKWRARAKSEQGRSINQSFPKCGPPPAASAPGGKWLKMQVLRPHP